MNRAPRRSWLAKSDVAHIAQFGIVQAKLIS